MKHRNWREVAKLMGAVFAKQQGGEVYMMVSPEERGLTRSRRIIVSDNGGEVNLSEIVPLIQGSVPLPGRSFDAADRDAAMAYRLHCALYGHETDYAWPKAAEGDGR